MRTTKLALISGAALAAAFLVTMTTHHDFGRAGALAAHETSARQTASFVTNPIVPAESAFYDSGAQPIRTVDW